MVWMVYEDMIDDMTATIMHIMFKLQCEKGICRSFSFIAKNGNLPMRFHPVCIYTLAVVAYLHNLTPSTAVFRS